MSDPKEGMGNSGTAGEKSPPEAAQAAEIRAYVERLTNSPAFALSSRRTRLLKYLVERALAGEGDRINEYAIGRDVFDKPASFDPRIESAVRTEVSRLRQKLKEYYASAGRADRIVIDFPPRGYGPAFSFPRTRSRNQPAGALASEASRSNSKASLAQHAWWPSRIVALLAATFALWKWNIPAKQPIRSLVVLPFQNLSQGHENEYLADGVTEELTNELAQWKDMRVVARTSRFQFKGKGVDVREIGRKLNVDAAIEGSLEKQGDRIRITAQLNRTSDGYHLWSKAYEASFQDMLPTEGQIARSIADAVRNLDRRLPQPVIHPTTSNPEAHDLYLRASYVLSLKTPNSMKQGLALLEEAVAKDPGYATAYLEIADVEFAALASGLVPQKEGQARLRTALQKAIQADPNCADARGMLAGVIHSQDWDWPRAESEFKLAIDQGAGAATRSLYGWSLMTQGRFVEADAQFRIAQDLNPLGTGQRMNEASSFYLQREYGRARQILNVLLQEHPGMASAHAKLEEVDAVSRNCAGIQAQMDWELRTDPKADETLDRVVLSECRGDRKDAAKYFAAAARGMQSIDPYDAAWLCAYTHHKDLALSFLARAARIRQSVILTLKYEPAFDEIRSDPRYFAIEKTVGLVP